uniref:hypothetical protein n=1 Tax=Ligaoa zhengdingensis TaxID=2763658 RepID=UPI0031BB4F3A
VLRGQIAAGAFLFQCFIFHNKNISHSLGGGVCCYLLASGSVPHALASVFLGTASRRCLGGVAAPRDGWSNFNLMFIF